MGSIHSQHGATHREDSCGMVLRKENVTRWYLLECQEAVPAQMWAVAEVAAGLAPTGAARGSGAVA